MSGFVAKFNPFVCALKSNQKSLRCDFCFKSLNKGFECNVCHKYWYCDDICQKNDSMIHYFECDSKFNLRQLIATQCSVPSVREESDWTKFKDLDEFVTHSLLLLRILFKLKSDPKCGAKECPLGNGSSVSYDDISVPDSQRMHRVWDETEELEILKADLIDHLTYNFGAWLSAVRQVLASDFITNKLGVVSEAVLLRAFRIVVRYTLYVCDMSFLKEIGKAIYVEMCFISHSCIPNCGPLFNDNNVLNLRQLDPTVSDFNQMKYDFQIEMTAYSAQELSESLQIRAIECKCEQCLNVNQFTVNYHKILTKANLKYGNWLPLDYCQAMSEPIEEALDFMDKTHSKYHPFTTGLLLWKFRNQWLSYDSTDEELKDITGKYLLETFRRLKEAVSVTHGLEHIYYQKLSSIGEYLVQMADISADNYKIINETIEDLIPRTVIEQKLF